METNKITSELRCFIRQRFGVPEDDPAFHDDVDLFNYGYIDSFGAVELTTFMESQFSIRLTDSDWVTFPLSTINEISSFVLARRNGKL